MTKCVECSAAHLRVTESVARLGHLVLEHNQQELHKVAGTHPLVLLLERLAVRKDVLDGLELLSTPWGHIRPDIEMTATVGVVTITAGVVTQIANLQYRNLFKQSNEAQSAVS